MFRFNVGLPDSEFFSQLPEAHFMMPLLIPDADTYAVPPR